MVVRRLSMYVHPPVTMSKRERNADSIVGCKSCGRVLRKKEIRVSFPNRVTEQN